MPRLIAFLRAINVGGHNVKMAALRRLFEGLGLADVETLIASGNVIFSSRSRNINSLQQKIEDHLHQSLGFGVSTFLRTDGEVAAIGERIPFTDYQLAAAVALNIGFLANPLTANDKQALMRLRTDIDDFHVHGREVYWLCKKKQSESKFSNAVFEKTLNVRSTFRTAKTIERLAAKYPPPR